MSVNSINRVNDYSQKVVFKGETNLIKEKKQSLSNEQDIPKISIKKATGYAVASALAAATLAGAVIHGKMNKQLRNVERAFNDNLRNARKPLQNEIDKLERNINDLQGQVRTKSQEAENLSERLNRANSERDILSSQNSALRQEIENTRDRFNGLLDGITDEGAKYQKLKTEIDNKSLGYDVMEPPVTGIKANDAQNIAEVRHNLPPRVKTGNRSEMEALYIPEVSVNGHFKFALPTSSQVRVTKTESVDFKPRHDFPTSVSESYSDSVRWDNDKIARDILQNFYDGHGQTLDGVRFKFEPTSTGKYRVRIEGDSSYTADKAIYMGESTKRENANAAGNYGEGLKMAALKLLRDKGAKNVKVGSDNWDLTFKLSKDDLLKDKNVMAYDLDKRAEKQVGNYIEFETDDKELLETMKKTIDRFYHSHNVHFKNPDYEDSLVGVKLLPDKKDKGAIYICGQRFEFDNDYDGLQGAVIFLKEKPPKDVLDPSRDRTTLNSSDLGNIAAWINKRMGYSKDSRLKFIHMLEPYWGKKNAGAQSAMDIFLDKFIMTEYYRTGNLLINFPKDKYVAYSMASSDVVKDLERKGFIVCEDNFAHLGMQTIKDLYGEARKHDPIIPDKVNLTKIKILREAIQKLSKGLKDEFGVDELNTKIFLFNAKSDKERRMYGNVQGEAITDFGKSKGFWVDVNYFRNVGFSEMLETALHELCHKAGGDMSSEFSYKLTDVNAKAIKQIMEDPQIRSELRMLNRLWNECNNSQISA